jgi:hypothetical protein
VRDRADLLLAGYGGGREGGTEGGREGGKEWW